MKQVVLVGASLVFLVLLRFVNRRNEQRQCRENIAAAERESGELAR